MVSKTKIMFDRNEYKFVPSRILEDTLNVNGSIVTLQCFIFRKPSKLLI